MGGLVVEITPANTQFYSRIAPLSSLLICKKGLALEANFSFILEIYHFGNFLFCFFSSRWCGDDVLIEWTREAASYPGV